jgi:O-antigen/teichoic acid export membrane protein
MLIETMLARAEAKAPAVLRPFVSRIADIVRGKGESAAAQRTAVLVFFMRVVSAAIAYISQVLMARWMGDFSYGVFVAVWVWIVIFGGICGFGLQTGVIRFISEYRTSGQADHLRGAIRGALGWSFLASTFVALAGAATLHAFPQIVAGHFLAPLFLAIVCLPLLTLQEVQDGVARAFNWPILALGPTFLVRPVAILLVMAAFVAAGASADAPTAMAAAIVAVWGSSLVQFALIAARLRGKVPAGPARFLPRRWMAVALPIFLVEGFYVLLTNTDILFVSIYLSPEQVAIYFASVKTLALAHFVYFAVKAGAAHRFVAFRAAGEEERYLSFIRETVRWTFWPTLAFAVLMAVFGKYFLMLFGPSFLEGEVLLWILGVGVVIRASVGAAESVLTMSGEQNACAVVYGASLVFNLFLNVWLIPLYGLVGAAVATSITMAFEAAALHAAAKRRLGVHIFIVTPSDRPAMAGAGTAR